MRLFQALVNMFNRLSSTILQRSRGVRTEFSDLLKGDLYRLLETTLQLCLVQGCTFTQAIWQKVNRHKHRTWSEVAQCSNQRPNVCSTWWAEKTSHKLTTRLHMTLKRIRSHRTFVRRLRFWIIPCLQVYKVKIKLRLLSWATLPDSGLQWLMNQRPFWDQATMNRSPNLQKRIEQKHTFRTRSKELICS